MCAGRFLLMHEERLPPGAASGVQQGAPKAAASAMCSSPCADGGSSGNRFCVALPLWCMPGGAGWRYPLARAEIRLSTCRMCVRSSAVIFPLLGMVCVAHVRCR